MNTDTATSLNEKLYQDVLIPQNELDSIVSDIKKYNCLDAMGHKYRIYHTLRWLKELIKTETHCLDLGGKSVFTHFFKDRLPLLKVDYVNGDLRLPWEYEAESKDFVICTEVLEHLNDLPKDFNGTFEKSGLKAVLSAAFRVLKPNGCLFVTTPNGVSMSHLYAILYGYAPRFFSPHVREYSLGELIPEIKMAGFNIVKFTTIHCLTTEPKKDFTKIYQFLLDNNLPVVNRGDDIFLLARKEQQ